MLVKPVREPKIESTNSTASSNVNNSHNLAVHKQAFYSIAKCVATLTVNNEKEGQTVITQFVNDIKV